MAVSPLAQSSPPAPQLVALLDVEPDLAAGIDAKEVVAARRLTAARLVAVPEGDWKPSSLADGGAFAAFLVRGLIYREIQLADRRSIQLLGPGDLLPLSEPEEAVPGAVFSCRAVTRTDLAVLDARFLAASQRWPWLTARLVERTARWADRGLALQAISQLGRVDLRIVAILWHLADRWGRVVQSGVFVPLQVTHETIGCLVGGRRSTISIALKELREAGLIERHKDGWLLNPESRRLLRTAEV